MKHISSVSAVSVIEEIRLPFSDEEEPMFLSVPENITIVIGGHESSGNATWDIPRVWDNSGNYTLSSTHKPGDTFNVGATTVTYTATDDAGNMVTATFVVYVTGNKSLFLW